VKLLLYQAQKKGKKEVAVVERKKHKSADVMTTY
jgi:hypothetical protein